MEKEIYIVVLDDDFDWPSEIKRSFEDRAKADEFCNELNKPYHLKQAYDQKSYDDWKAYHANNPNALQVEQTKWAQDWCANNPRPEGCSQYHHSVVPTVLVLDPTVKV